MAKSTELAMAKKKTKPVRDDPDLIRFVDDDEVNALGLGLHVVSNSS